ncbi:MAG: hypothetical protein PHU24_05015 [Sphaerochaetaceae bacterium]|jgi:hypothetical protein|nr:hypothetical protein [Sphaerochaetaceae bacterium]NLO59699.1 hypothetical protein [Spirochaetales bacterium]MDD2405798.1 hypothetical protein [Sphaerochaetaceae bacterium]MDD3671499.1 hypothetical protein [Sphaerochaetaceae bacterium]MDD4258347.1 hypothetical protein [Sphaerochaetaceae bacterium]
MRKIGFFGSLLTAIIFAAVLFFVIYFFLPSVSNQFFGFSYRGAQDTKAMKSAVKEILIKADIPQSRIDEYLERWEEPGFQQKFAEATSQGKEAVLDFLASVGEGIDFKGIDVAGFKRKLEEGFSESRLAEFTRQQKAAITRLLSNALEKLE